MLLGCRFRQRANELAAPPPTKRGGRQLAVVGVALSSRLAYMYSVASPFRLTLAATGRPRGNEARAQGGRDASGSSRGGGGASRGRSLSQGHSSSSNSSGKQQQQQQERQTRRQWRSSNAPAAAAAASCCCDLNLRLRAQIPLTPLASAPTRAFVARGAGGRPQERANESSQPASQPSQ